MFTGLVESKAMLLSCIAKTGGARFGFQLDKNILAGVSPGDSISVSGVCLTAVDVESDRFHADISAETLDKTTLGDWATGRYVNIELSLKLGDRLGGHLVSGHVDGRTVLLAKQQEGSSWRFEFQIPSGLERLIARKGSVCVDGVSLTVNDVNNEFFSVCVIPHTLEVTTLGELHPGFAANLEIDIIARYLERLQEQQGIQIP